MKWCQVIFFVDGLLRFSGTIIAIYELLMYLICLRWRFWTVWSKDNHFGATSKEILITELELDFNSLIVRITSLMTCKLWPVLGIGWTLFKGLAAQTEKQFMKVTHESPERRSSKHENIRTNWPGQLLSFWTAWPHWLSLGKSETEEKQAGFHFVFILIS